MAASHEEMLELEAHDEELVAEYKMEIMLLKAENVLLRSALVNVGRACSVTLDTIRNASTNGEDTKP